MIDITKSDESTQDVQPNLYAHARANMAANDAIYEHLSTCVRDMLPQARPQEIEDALNMTCVSLRQTPLDALLLIHEFLKNCTDIAKRRVSE